MTFNSNITKGPGSSSLSLPLHKKNVTSSIPEGVTQNLLLSVTISFQKLSLKAAGVVMSKENDWVEM